MQKRKQFEPQLLENSLINNNGDLDTNITTVQTTTKVSTPKVDVKQEVVKQPEAKEEEKVLKEEKPSNKTTTDENLNYDPNYVFDPQVASDELGLPIDLIEEFIEDFIAQAQEFKDELYKYLAEEDINNVRILSHKLKGVAANLRVEDAFEVLATINTATDLKVIKENLNIFYKIIAKLSGEEIDMEHIEVAQEEDDDLLVLEFKDDNDIITPPKEKVTVDNELNLEIVPSLTDLPISYNKEDVAKEMGIDTDTFNQLFEDYLTDAMQICNSIKEAISKNDSKRWNQETIQLKGMSENMRVELFINELEVLLKTSRQDEASGAIEHIISIISTMKV
jgi:HPt (histidine-containing phosphotransfer) domain-containing protein